MKTITNYVRYEFLKAFGFILLCLFAIAFIIDFVTRINSFLSKNATAAQIAKHFAWQIPFLTSLMIPVSSLLAVMVVFTVMSRNNEIIALKAGGISVTSLVKPLLPIALAIALFNAILNGFVAPYGLKCAQLVTNEVQKRQDVFTFKQNGIWYKDENTIYNFAFYDPQKEELRGVSAFVFDKNFNIVTRLHAPTAFWNGSKWNLRDVAVVSLPRDEFPVLERRAQAELPLREKPRNFGSLHTDTSMMTLLEMKEYANYLHRAGSTAAHHLTEMHGKIAFPLVNLLLVVIGAAFSITFGREGGMAGNIGVGIAIGFSYWILHAVAVTIGKSGYIPPILAAWSANFAFGILAFLLLRRVRT